MRRLTRRVLAAMALVALASCVPPAVHADPVSDANAHLKELQRQAEDLTESWHAAQDKFDAANDAVTAANAAADKANAAAEEAKNRLGQFRGEVDQFTSASYQGAQFGTVSALLSSGSASEFLDQMSALEGLSANNATNMDRLTQIANEVSDAQAQAEDARKRAEQALSDAAAAKNEIDQRKKEMDSAVDKARDELHKLEQAGQHQQDPGMNGPGSVPNSGIPAAALNWAISQQGKPYYYGHVGPNDYDCSGLVLWAYAHLHIGLPHSAAGQSGLGVRVPLNQLQPGDLLFYDYGQGVKHVGFYVSPGTQFDAPETGSFVGFHPIYDHLVSARRIG